MTCPKCGLQALPEQKFCRSCGASLQVITQPLSETTTISELKEPSAIAVQHAGQRGSSLLLWGFIIVFLGAAIGVVGKKLMHDEIVTVVGILVSFIGMFLAIYPYVSPSRRTRDDSPSQSEVSTQSEPKSVHESGVEYLPSVTERTTDLLKTPAARITKQKEGGA